MHIQTAQLLDQFTVRKNTLSTQERPITKEELNSFICLTSQVIDALQTDNDQLFSQVANVKQGLITALEAASA